VTCDAFVRGNEIRSAVAEHQTSGATQASGQSYKVRSVSALNGFDTAPSIISFR
jgi:hypothetical protein